MHMLVTEEKNKLEPTSFHAFPKTGGGLESSSVSGVGDAASVRDAFKEARRAVPDENTTAESRHQCAEDIYLKWKE